MLTTVLVTVSRSTQKGTSAITSHLRLTLCQLPLYNLSFVGVPFSANMNYVQSLVRENFFNTFLVGAL